MKAVFAAGAVVALSLATAKAGEDTDRRIDALIAAYPQAGLKRQGNRLVWPDGTAMTIDDGRAKTHQQKLKDADIEDMVSQPYPVGACSYGPPGRNVDPGRIRNDRFFRWMYGKSASRVRANLRTVSWFGRQVRVSGVNGVDRRLAAVAADLARLAKPLHKYFTRTAGTFNWRKIAGTNRLSVHSFGAAIDINVKFGDYWRWAGGKPGKVKTYRNRIPRQIVEAFERHGFIWGGKWYHYDTMHFEYRPELIAVAKQVACQ